MTDHDLSIRISGALPESVVDGPGLRAVVFFQGCPHHCPGCHNPETWDFQGGTGLSVAEVWALLNYNPLLSGITLSGGEPLAQPEAALALARKTKEARGNVMIYTGYTWEELRLLTVPVLVELLDLTDLLVDGPFILAEKADHLPFRGSYNQRIIDVKVSLGRETPVLWEQNGGSSYGLATAGS
jgi:anaerobic ribonucleoside-triphosphate reductase activating protein